MLVKQPNKRIAEFKSGEQDKVSDDMRMCKQ